MFILLFFVSQTDSSALRELLVQAMGLEKTFSGYSMVSENRLQLRGQEFPIDHLERVSLTDSRWAHGNAENAKTEGFDGQRAWESAAIAGSRPEATPQADEATQRRRALHGWRTHLIVLLKDPKLQPKPITRDANTGLQFVDPDSGLLLAELIVADHLPNTLYIYGFPHADTGVQSVEIQKFSSFKKVDGVTLPYRIDVESTTESGQTVTMAMNIQRWTLHESIDPDWFTPPN